jgi:hypothetical protein
MIFSRRSFSRSSLALSLDTGRCGTGTVLCDEDCGACNGRCQLDQNSTEKDVQEGRGSHVHRQSPPTSTSSSITIPSPTGPGLDGCPKRSLSPNASAIFRRLSSGEVTDEVLRLLLAAGAHLSKDLRRFRSPRKPRLLVRLRLRVLPRSRCLR